jgi:hypothetical protein
MPTDDEMKAVAEWRAKLADSMTASLNAAVTAKKDWIIEDDSADEGGQIFVGAGAGDFVPAMRKAGKDWTTP